MQIPKLIISNWEKYQQYGNGSGPAWIKLYIKILDSYGFEGLQDNAKAHMICLMLLAARTDNHIPDDPEWIGKKINATTPINIDKLIKIGFLERCSCSECASIKEFPRARAYSIPIEEREEKREKEIAHPRAKNTKAEEDFATWYAAYPKKKAVAYARKTWHKLYKSLPPVVDLIAKLERQKLDRDWLKDGGTFIPYPATYLNQGGWEDEIKQNKNISNSAAGISGTAIGYVFDNGDRWSGTSRVSAAEFKTLFPDLDN